MNPNGAGLAIVLSAGGDRNELAAHGLGEEHLNELMVRMAMQLLRAGHRLAFGGTLGDPTQRLTQQLIDTATNWVGDEMAKSCDVNKPETWPLTNYSAWPFHTTITDVQRARLVGICRFITIDPPKSSQDDLVKLLPDWKKNSQARLRAADALSAMREVSTRETDLRIVWGGKIAGSSGWMPGILEEIGFSLQHGKPFMILGGFGGCASLLADFVVNLKAEWPSQLSLSANADPERDALRTADQRKSLELRYQKIEEQLRDFRSKLHTEKSVYGLDSKSLKEALREGGARRAIQLAVSAASECAGS